jgi:hypothetical protein
LPEWEADYMFQCPKGIRCFATGLSSDSYRLSEFVDYEQSPGVLSTQVAGGNPPDIV